MSLNSLFGISFVVTRNLVDAWGRQTADSLNSLFGISFVVTRIYHNLAQATLISDPLNSLFGISFVVTWTVWLLIVGYGILSTLNSLFGISFVVTRVSRPARGRSPRLSIPFLGFLLL